MSGYRPANAGNRSALRVGPKVTRRLRAAGVNVSSAARKFRHEGIYVSARGLSISVLVDLGTPYKVREAAQDVARVVTSWGIKAEVTEKEHDDGGLVAWVRFTYPDAPPADRKPTAAPGRVGPGGEAAPPDGMEWMRVQATTVTATLASAGFWSSHGVTVEQVSTTAVAVRIAEEAPEEVREGVLRALARKRYTTEPGDGALIVRNPKKAKRI
ncbi:hypothetical protein [Streptomyces griseoaurantiacus]|uniref:hypothetical protein n=1 Tax=Streptomyces griseoaurantiacus TaxID=68213 RepID=UPI00369B2550